MESVFDKLNLKEQGEILVLNAPAAFDAELRKLAGVTVRRRLPVGRPVAFALVFATRKSEVDSVVGPLARAAPGDAIVWFAYPKGTSRRYTCDFNRDTGWGSLGRSVRSRRRAGGRSRREGPGAARPGEHSDEARDGEDTAGDASA